MKFTLVALLSMVAMVAAADECPQDGFWYTNRTTLEPCHSECEVKGGTCVLNCPIEDPRWFCGGTCQCP